jgi:hypothetical protein
MKNLPLPAGLELVFAFFANPHIRTPHYQKVGGITMKRCFSVFAVVVLFLSFVVPVLAEETVWIATSGRGERYHYENCRTLRGGKKEVPISEAKAAGYTGCGWCHR